MSPVFSLPRDMSIFKKLCLLRKLSVVPCRIFFSQRAVPPSFQCPLIVVPSRKLLRGDRGPFIVINRKKRCSRGCVYSDVQSESKLSNRLSIYDHWPVLLVRLSVYSSSRNKLKGNVLSWQSVCYILLVSTILST